MENPYSDKMQSVIRYMQDHLHEKISLEQLAGIAHFSKYHFSRVFAAMIGLSPSAYLSRLRLNKTMELLAQTELTMLEVSQACGFESQSHFNAAFKKEFKQTPGEARRVMAEKSKISLKQSNKAEETSSAPRYDNRGNHHFLRRIWEMNITVTELPDYEVGFVRHVGSYLETHKEWEKLGAWAAGHALYPPEQIYIGISLDDPAETEEQNCRYDACLTIPAGFAKDEGSEIGFRTLPGGLYGKYEFYDTIDKLAIAYQSLFGQWLPASDYDPDDRHCLEFCMNNPFDDLEGKAKVDLYIPIKARV